MCNPYKEDASKNPITISDATITQTQNKPRNLTIIVLEYERNQVNHEPKRLSSLNFNFDL